MKQAEKKPPHGAFSFMGWNKQTEYDILSLISEKIFSPSPKGE